MSAGSSAPSSPTSPIERGAGGAGAGDRLGVRWGLAGGTALASIDEVCEVARYAVAAGFDSLWISHANAVDPIVALASTAAETTGLVEVGTSVVPLYGRHPIGLAQLARTAQSALHGRFTLGIGAASRNAVRTSMGLAWNRPLAHTRDFIAGLQPLLAGEVADVDGESVTTHAELNIAAAGTPILLAALGPRMLELAGRRVQGTTLGQCGPRTIASYVAPALHAAAEAEGRPTPRIMALIRICVTDDPGPAYALARETAAR
ncbi:MAG: LLM class flavin-dependent oxidoreductase, partial [Ilumatobacteraceae bacterium]